MKNEKNANQNPQVMIPCGKFCGKNCADGCIYWQPYDRRDDGKQYCTNFGSYFYPDERNGCIRFQD